MRGYKQEPRVTPAQAIPSLVRVQSHCVWRWQAGTGAGKSPPTDPDVVSDELVQGPPRESSQEQQETGLETVLERRSQRSFKVHTGDTYTFRHCSRQDWGCSGQLRPIGALTALKQYHLHTTCFSTM